MKKLKVTLLTLTICSCTSFADVYYNITFNTDQQQANTPQAKTMERTSEDEQHKPVPMSMVTAASNVRASFRGRLYDSYGYLENGRYYRTAPNDLQTEQQENDDIGSYSIPQSTY